MSLEQTITTADVPPVDESLLDFDPAAGGRPADPPVSGQDGLSAILRFAVGAQADRNRAELGLLFACGAWADAHPVTPDEEVDWTRHDECLGGDGCPDMDRFAIAEFACRLHLSQGSATGWIGEALELRHRLPRLWRLTQAERLPVWQARRIAHATISLSREAARFVDAQLAAVRGRVGAAQLDRTVALAVKRHMPELADRQAAEAAEHRHVHVDFDRDGSQGAMAQVSACVSHLDGLDLEQALQSGAAALRAGGSPDSLQVRRSMALGDLARGQTGLDLTSTNDTHATSSDTTSSDTTPGAWPEDVWPEDHGRDDHDTSEPEWSAAFRVPARVAQPVRPVGSAGRGRELVVYVMIDPVTGAGQAGTRRIPISAETLRQWCGAPSTTKITIRPVLDLNQSLSTTAYRIPARISEHVALRDQRCAFPYCDRPAHPIGMHTDTSARDGEDGSAGRDYGVDIDHIVPYDHDHPDRTGGAGPTHTTNLGPLCRWHHLLKTLTRWRYTMLRPGVYIWVDPSGHAYLRTRQGTLDLGPPAPPDSPAPDPPPRD